MHYLNKFYRQSLCLIISCSVFLISCKEDEGRSCTTCSSSVTAAFELCKESNGNASVNGEDTDTEYDAYLSGLQEEGVQCEG